MEKNIFNSLEQAEKAGFEGFYTIKELRKDLNKIPKIKGVYMVIRDSETTPSFNEIGTGGYFKGKEPNVTTSELQNNWVNSVKTVYIGKAGAIEKSATLYSRLKQYLAFGGGKNIGHYGGRYIWQLSDVEDLLICWKIMPSIDIEPVELEKEMIRDFKTIHNGNRPFANLKD